MVRIAGPSELADLTGGATEFEVDARSVLEAIRMLDVLHPGLGNLIDRKMAFAIDGEIYQDSWNASLDGAQEIVIIPRIGGG